MIEYIINILSFKGTFRSRDDEEFGYRVYQCIDCGYRVNKCKELVVESQPAYKSELCAINDAILEIEKIQVKEVNIIKHGEYDKNYNQCDIICEITIIDRNIVEQLKQIKQIFNNPATV